MNPVIMAIDAGHIAHWTKNISISKQTEEVPTNCKKDNERWPCAVIVVARQQHRSNRGEK